MTQSLLGDEQVEIKDKDWEGKWNNGELNMIMKKPCNPFTKNEAIQNKLNKLKRSFKITGFIL